MVATDGDANDDITDYDIPYRAQGSGDFGLAPHGTESGGGDRGSAPKQDL